MVSQTQPDRLTAERIRLWGVVQGVGLRPCIARLAETWQLRGAVRNRGGLVEIIALVSPARRDGFRKALLASLPAPARVIRQLYEPLRPLRLPARSHGRAICLQPRTPDRYAGGVRLLMSVNQSPGRRPPMFRILASDPLPGLAFPSPDLPVCLDCLTDMDNPGNRRFRHPLVSCMACGPRFSIIRSLPYDRARTSLSRFPLCARCASEYRSTSDRRFHAQTISCLDCGPQLRWLPTQDRMSAVTDQEGALAAAIAAIRAGAVVAVKGIGGYHLACDPASEPATACLRLLKNRERKPFAVMYPDLATLACHAEVTAAEAQALGSDARPIVLVRRRLAERPTPEVLDALAPGVCGRSAQIGAFLPYTPLQVLLARACGPLVMTSANPADEPIIFRDQDMLAFAATRPALAGILTHDRPILRGLDDSVVRLVGERTILIRRSRGYVPLAIDLGQIQASDVAENQPDPERLSGTPSDPVVLAAGGDLKAAFAIVHQQFAWLSAPVGDLESLPVHEHWLAEQDAMCDLLRLRPTLVVTDLHPGYVSSQLAGAILDEPVSEEPVPRLAFQHHEAHVASVLAEHRLAGPALGLAFDGTGYGRDGTVWGGEGLLIDADGCRRLGGLRPTRLPGGDAGMKDAWRSLLGYLLAAGADPADPEWNRPFASQPAEAVAWLSAAWRQDIGCPRNSSMGRLFDAVCAWLGLSDRNHYEGECGSLLEDCARAAADAGQAEWPLRFALHRDAGSGLLLADPDPLWRSLLAARRQNIEPGRVALGFHAAVVAASQAMLRQWANETGVRTVAISGGVFQNALLSKRLDDALRGDGFAVYWNGQVPPNDGGICLGQAWLALREQRPRT